MPKIHCAKGPKGCEKCREFLAEGDSFALIRAYLTRGMIARPMTEIIFENKSILCEYDVLQRFENEIEATKYAKNRNIEIIKD